MNQIASALPNLRVLDEMNISRELDSVTELFHRINRIIPENQELLTISPDKTVRDAIALLRRTGYSQAPVVTGGDRINVFLSNREEKCSKCAGQIGIGDPIT